MRQMEMPASPRARVFAFMEAFRRAPNDADIEIRGGTTEDGEPAILVTISGGGDHAFTVREARKIADIMETTMRELPGHPASATLPNIIMGLREGCDRVEQITH